MWDTFARGGQVGHDLAAVDWDATGLGPPDSWPRSLQTAVRMVLGSRFSMWMAWGPDLTFFCNEAYRRDTLGSKYPWALGRPVQEVWPEVWPEVEPRIERVVGGGESTWDENLQLFVERSGYVEETFHTFSYSPLTDDDGAIAGLLCVVAETTHEVIARRRMTVLTELGSALADQLTERETLAATSRVLAGAVEALPMHLLYLVDSDGEGARLAGSAGVPEGHPAAPAHVPRDGGPWPWPTAADHMPVVDDLAERFDLPVGPRGAAPQRAAVVPVPGTPGSSYGFLVLGLNPFRPFDTGYADFLGLVAGHVGAAITDARAYDLERARAEKLAELDRAKTDFFTNVSHELRTPLTLLLAPVEDALADDRDPLPPRQRERLELVQRSGLRLLRLVNNLLSFSRLEHGKVDAIFEPVDLAALTQDLADSFVPAAQRLGLDLEIDCPRLPEQVFVDPELWAGAVLNLLSNALKFTIEGRISLELRAEGGQAVLAVSDTGIGIAPEDQARVFQRFQRVTQHRSRSHEGSGIGLALVAEVAVLHGGGVTVKSEPDHGSVFELRVPFGSAHLPDVRLAGGTGAAVAPRVVEGFLAEAAQLGDASRAEAERPVGGGRPTVLVVDDNADLRRYVVSVLADEYDVRTAADGEEALAAALAAPPDLVLSDVMMPGLDGLELLAELRRRPETVGVPVVMISARGGEDAQVEGLEAGADDYLVKPFGSRELRARVRATLELDRSRRTREQLETSRELLGQAQRLARVGSWSYDLDEDRLDVSAEFLRIVDREGAELERAGFPGFLVELAHPFDQDLVRAVLATADMGDEIAFEARLLRPDGTTVHASVRGELTSGPDGARIVRGSLQDVTERHRAEETIALAHATAEVAAREHQIAAELQESLLPERTFDLKHLDVATFYRPGQEGTEVGGDWYDVIDLPGGGTALVMGDVMGHGIHAAAVMGQLRTAVRAYARLGMPPAALLEAVDLLVWELFPDQIVTCVYAEFTPEDHAVRLVNAGHVPPVVVRADGDVQRLGGEPHPPLGLGRPFDDPTVVVLEAQDALLLYTDGLVERRGRDVEAGITELAGHLAGLRLPLAEMPEALVRMMLPGGPEDDVALLVARNTATRSS